MSANEFIIKDQLINREEWHNNNIDTIIKLYYIFENKIKEQFPNYKIESPVDNDKFNKFSRLIYLNSSGNLI
jgi:hypothetical protein